MDVIIVILYRQVYLPFHTQHPACATSTFIHPKPADNVVVCLQLESTFILVSNQMEAATVIHSSCGLLLL